MQHCTPSAVPHLGGERPFFMLCPCISLHWSLRASFHLCPRGASPPTAACTVCLQNGLLPTWPGLRVSLDNQALFQHLTRGFAAPCLCPGMVTLCKGHPARLAEPLLHPAITVVIPPFTQTHTHRACKQLQAMHLPTQYLTY